MTKIDNDQVTFVYVIGLIVVFALGFFGITGYYQTDKEKALAASNNPQLMCFAKASNNDQFKICENLSKETK